MEKTIFEEIGYTYTQVGDYLLTDLQLSKGETKPIGVWEHRHLRYIKQYKRLLYFNLLTSSKVKATLSILTNRLRIRFFGL